MYTRCYARQCYSFTKGSQQSAVSSQPAVCQCEHTSTTTIFTYYCSSWLTDRLSYSYTIHILARSVVRHVVPRT